MSKPTVRRYLKLLAPGTPLRAGVDRILDMMRTTVNVTGDAAVATCVDAMQKRAAARKARKAEKAAA